MVLSFITVIFLLLYACLFFYYLKGWRSLQRAAPPGDNQSTPVSVIVPARNEEQNIARLIRSLKAQTCVGDGYEIIIVDDGSTDSTADIVKQFQASNISLIRLPAGAPSSKKMAISAGIRLAKGELIVCTDADCTHPPEWLKTLHDFYISRQASFIAAPVKFTYDSSLLQKFQALDFLTLQGITAASVATGFHTMCNGANLAYPKKTFEAVNGFDGIDRVATGDDMLLMFKIWKNDPQHVYYLKNENAIVSTAPMPTWRAFFMQRKRWASKSLVYDDFRIITVLGFVYLFNLLFFALVAAAITDPAYWWHVAGFWIAKTMIETPFVYSVARFYQEKHLVKYLLPFQPLHIFYTVFIGLVSQFGKYEWKGRTTK